MQLQQGNMLGALEDAKTFLGANAAEIGSAVNEATVKLLETSIEDLTTHASTQDAHTRAGAGALNRQRIQRGALVRDHMRPIARIALLDLPNTPDFIKLTLPKTRVSLQQLVALADGMAEAATPFAATFIAAGCNPDFISQLKAAAQDIRTAGVDRTTSRAKVTEATVEMRAKLSRARKVIGVIDAFLLSALADKPGLLQAWNNAKRVRSQGIRSSSAGAAPAVEAPTVATPEGSAPATPAAAA